MSAPARPLSGLERVWLVADRLLPPFVIQLLLEGEGQVPASAWEAALQRAAEALPGARVRLRGWLRGARWEHDGPLPRFRRAEAPAWDGMSEAGAPFLLEPLDPRGPVVELVSCGPRLVLRALHAAMDGRGLLLFAEALFAALRGEAPPAATDLGLRDADLLDAAQLAEPGRPPARTMPPLSPPGSGPRPIWRRRRLEGDRRVAELIAALAPGRARVDVPVDLRRHRPGLLSTANLTGLVRLELGPGVDIEAALAGAIERGEHLRFVAQGERLRGLPLWLLVAAGRGEAKKGQQTGRYGSSGTVSHLGRVRLDRLSGGGFHARRAAILPPASPDLPVLITALFDEHGLEVVAAAPQGGEPERALERLS